MVVNEKTTIKRAVYKVFTKKYGLHVQTGAAEYLEEYLTKEEDLLGALERIVAAYKKRFNEGSSLIITEDIIKEVIASKDTSAAVAVKLQPFHRMESEINKSLEGMSIQEPPADTVNVAEFFNVVSAFNMPYLSFDEQSNTFHESKERLTLAPKAEWKSNMYRERFKLAKQRLLRNENICDTELEATANPELIKVTPIQALIGHDKKKFVLFGMLTQIEERKIHLEDEDTYIELIVNEAKYDHGFYTDGSFVLAEGVYFDHRFYVSHFSLPPVEPRSITDKTFGHIDFMGLPKPLVDENLLKIEEQRNENITFVILSDVFLDHPKVMAALRIVFQGYEEAQVPLAFIMIGNFSREPFRYSGLASENYKKNFIKLGNLIAEFQGLATYSNWVFVPGPKDPWAGRSLPQPPILSGLVEKIRRKVKKITFTSNPCRIRYCTQDIVIFRGDWLYKLKRNTLLKTNANENDTDVLKHLLHTVVDQAHLSPLSQNSKPISWAYDNAMRLYPLPHALILADICPNYGVTYEGVHCINPGSFTKRDVVTANFKWTVYYPHSRTSEKCHLPHM